MTLGDRSHKPKGRLARRVLISGAALATARLLNRGLDIIRVVTIAKWLGPEEMGVYAVAWLVLTALDQFSETGLRQALIQRKGNIEPYILPVRTVQAVRGFSLGLIVFFSAPWVSDFFHSPRSLEILRTVAIIPIVQGIEPLVQTLEQRNLNFTPIVFLQSTASFVSLCIGLLAAYYRPDAWALVYSHLSKSLLITFGCYLLSDRQWLRFSFAWKSLEEIKNFGFWIFINYIFSYLFIKGSDWMIGRMLDVKALAIYQMAFLTCTTATSEIGVIILSLSFPVFSYLQRERSQLHSAFLQAHVTISVVTFGMAGIVCTCSPDFYRLILGDDWTPALVLVPWLTTWAVCSVFGGFLSGLFSALGRPKLWAQTVLCTTLILMLCLYPMVLWLGALGAAVLMACIGVSMQMVRFNIVARLLNLPRAKVFAPLFIPGLASVVSVVATNGIRELLPAVPGFTGLGTSAMSLSGTYCALLLFTHRWMDPSPLDLLKRVRRDLFDSNVAASAGIRE